MERSPRFSQNFLHSPRLVKALLSKTNIGPADTVYDIGGGKGIITAALAQRCRTVISVELDAQLARKLRDNLQTHQNVLIYEADFLSLVLPHTPYKVFANIPFNLSADILRKLTNTHHPPTTSYLVVQKEFAEKLIPKPDGYTSQLAASIGARFRVRIVKQLRSTDFYPQPKVATALIEVSLRPKALVDSEDLALFRDFIAYTYNAHQPNIASTLSRLFDATEFAHLAKALRYPANATPTQLSPGQWSQLFAFACQKRHRLEKLVGGQEKALVQKHSKRTKLHRTRHDGR